MLAPGRCRAAAYRIMILSFNNTGTGGPAQGPGGGKVGRLLGRIFLVPDGGSTLGMMNTERTILVLGGGGVKGITHVGAWKALREAGVEVAEIVGTSIGALVGASIAGARRWSCWRSGRGR
jgi:hypothetical protein